MTTHTAIDFDNAFRVLTGNAPFPWQRALYQEFVAGHIPTSCNLPTGLGKTSVVTVWLIALANSPDTTPRRLVYVVNRRTVVDQTTTEVEGWREKLATGGLHDALTSLCSLPLKENESPLALSTLRGQHADNREWSADPSRPAVIVGTVDMIGSRLLFSGYGVGFKARPLHAGFLGQDVLLVHDEAHLEPAFQELLIAIEKEQHGGERTSGQLWPKLRVMELSATSRGDVEVFGLTDKDRANREVVKRIEAKKTISLHELDDDKKLADRIAKIAMRDHMRDRAVLVFVRKVDDVEKIVKQLPKGSTQQLTGTLRGLERDRMADPRRPDGCPIFARFLKPPDANASEHERWKTEPKPGTVYLVCTSAGEVGVNISADDLVCDLSTFESMAQRFGRVNRFGNRNDTEIHVVHPTEFDEKDELAQRRMKTLGLLSALNGDGSPKALGNLNAHERLAAFAPTPTILPTSDILFDAWALTTIRGKLPGRPPVEPYLHGISGWEPPETHVAWREEVGVITGELLLERYEPEDLLEDYPLKPHELLRDNSNRVFDRLKKLAADAETPVWLVADDDSVEVTTLGDLIDAGKDELNYKTVLLPPAAGGLENGLLASHSAMADDVADESYDEKARQRRIRVWDDDSRRDEARSVMRLIRTIDTKPEADEAEEEPAGQRLWHWYELPSAGDGDGSKSSREPTTWDDHTNQVTANAIRIAKALKLPSELQHAIKVAAKFHDLGKKREVWQRSIGNPKPTDWHAKSGTDPVTGKRWKPVEITDYRHEFGSLLNVLDENQLHFTELQALPSNDLRNLVLHLIAVHHGRGRPHFPPDEAFDPQPSAGVIVNEIAAEVPRRFARLQRMYGRWGLAYLESLLRAADYAASAAPSAFVEDLP